MNCSKNKNCIADILPKSTHNQPYLQNRVVVNFPRNLTFITFNYCHLLFIPLKYFSVFSLAQIAPT